MNKKEAEGIGTLIVVAIVVYPFIWLYEQIGGIGLGVCAAALVGAWIWWHIHQSRADQQAFDELALYAVNSRMHPDEAKAINQRLQKSNFRRAALIRNLQIVRDSIEISLSSKKRDTAESRAELVVERYQEIKREQASLVSEKVMAEIDRVVSGAQKDFHTKLYLNVANGYVEKARSLKTDKSKIKYLGLAEESLDEGIHVARGDIDRLRQALSDVQAEMSEYA